MQKSTLSTAKASRLSNQTKELLTTGICICCIFLLVYTAYAKIEDQSKFYEGLLHISYIGNFALPISWLVPISELLIAALLIVPKMQQIGLFLFVGLMTAFTIYISSMLLWAEKMPCHCGGAIEKLSWSQHLWFNIAFIILACLGIWLKKQSKNL